MASEVKKPKGILKASSSFDQPDIQHPDRKEMKWDEMNILATHHPADKDYGHMKIDEPKTPYNRMSDSEDNDGENRRHSVSDQTDVDPLSNLASRLEQVDNKEVKGQSGGEDESSSEEEEELTEQEKATRRVFEQKRKLHYNEFQAVKLAKQLMEEEEEEEDEKDEMDDKVQDESVDKVQDQDSNTADSKETNI